jgi:hypothetical protein
MRPSEPSAHYGVGLASTQEGFTSERDLVCKRRRYLAGIGRERVQVSHEVRYEED